MRNLSFWIWWISGMKYFQWNLSYTYLAPAVDAILSTAGAKCVYMYKCIYACIYICMNTYIYKYITAGAALPT